METLLPWLWLLAYKNVINILGFLSILLLTSQFKFLALVDVNLFLC